MSETIAQDYILDLGELAPPLLPPPDGGIMATAVTVGTTGVKVGIVIGVAVGTTSAIGVDSGTCASTVNTTDFAI